MSDLHAILSHELGLCGHPLLLKLLPLPHKRILLLLLLLPSLKSNPLLLHMLLHWHTDGAGYALALLVVFQQLPRSYTPAGQTDSCSEMRRSMAHD